MDAVRPNFSGILWMWVIFFVLQFPLVFGTLMSAPPDSPLALFWDKLDAMAPVIARNLTVSSICWTGVFGSLIMFCNLITARVLLRKSLGNWNVLDPWYRGVPLEVTELKRRIVTWSIVSAFSAMVLFGGILRLFNDLFDNMT